MSSIRVGGQPKNLSKSTEDSALLDSEKFNEILTEVGIEVKKTRTTITGKNGQNENKPRNVTVKLCNGKDKTIFELYKKRNTLYVWKKSYSHTSETPILRNVSNNVLEN